MELDISKWSLGERKAVAVTKPAKRLPSKKFKHFISAPLPYDWITSAAKLPGKSLHVAMVIRYLVGVSKNSTIMLAHSPAAEFGVGVKALYSALKCLEGAKLIAVHRHVGRAPRITVLNGQGSAEDIDAAG